MTFALTPCSASAVSTALPCVPDGSSAVRRAPTSTSSDTPETFIAKLALAEAPSVTTTVCTAVSSPDAVAVTVYEPRGRPDTA